MRRVWNGRSLERQRKLSHRRKALRPLGQTQNRRGRKSQRHRVAREANRHSQRDRARFSSQLQEKVEKQNLLKRN